MRSITLFSAWIVLAACAPEAPKTARTTTTTSTTPSADAKSNNPTTPTPNPTGTPAPGKDTPVAGTPVDNTIPAGPTTAAVTVAAGSNVVTFDLSTAKPALTGASFSTTLTVNAAAGATPASITFSSMALTTPASTGFVVYRPVLVLVAADGKEQQFPIGTDINVKVPKARSVPLGGLTSFGFSGIDTGAKIKLRFSALEPIANALLDGIPNYRDCKAPQNFQSVGTALAPCKSCHEGLFAYDFMVKDPLTACGQNLKIIDKTLSGTGTLPAIPSGTHHGANASAVGTAIGPWKTGEGL